MADHPVPGTDTDSSENPGQVREEWPAWLMLALLWGGSILVLLQLPERVPIHWDLHNQVNGWGSRWLAALLLPGIATAAYLFLLAMDWGGLDFRAAGRMAPATKRQVRALLLLLLCVLQAIILDVTLRGTLRGGALNACLWGFFILFGNLMPRLEPNSWAGICIPPTLENREVWKLTHRLGGKVFVIGGTLLLPTAFLPEPYPTVSLVAGLTLLSLIPIVYAYRLRAALPH